MFFYPKEIIANSVFINPVYKGFMTSCRFKDTRMDFAIDKAIPDNKITLKYHVIFESINNCDIVADISLSIISKFSTTNLRDDDLIALDHFLNESYLEIVKNLKHVIPNDMIALSTNLISEYDIRILKDAVSLELVELGFYL